MIKINRAAVIGSGVMGASIAAHLANAGLQVLLLDIVPKELTEAEKGKGLTIDSPEVRNRFATQGLAHVLKAKPACFYLPAHAELVETGNLEDDISKIKDCQWVIEVIVENMDIKKKLFADKVAPNLAPGAILSSNTSGLSVNEMSKALPDDIRKNFMVTHFFNPPRYMRLLEIAPSVETDPEVVRMMADFISARLGKGVVYAKDTPNFIANRIGVYSMFNCMKHMVADGLTVEEVDAVAGPASGRAKSAAFRTADMVGLDTLLHVADNSYENLPDDEQRDIFKPPEFIRKMVENGQLGLKSGSGFFKKDKVKGKSVISYFDYASGEYKENQRPKFGSIQAGKMVDDPGKRIKQLLSADDKAAQFAWKNLRDTIIYALNRTPEISDDVENLDNAMRWGFNWELGPFEMLDAIGIAYFVKRAQGDGVHVPDVLRKVESFYKFENRQKLSFDLTSGAYKEVPQAEGAINLEIIKQANAVVEKNANSSIIDIGDGVFCLEFHSKMNSISGDILSLTQKAVKRAEADGVGLVVGNQGSHFSAGANIMALAVAIAEGAFEDINIMIRGFQKATMSLKLAKVPVVAAPFGLTLGGGCEFALHSDAINAHGETYMGLVEMGVGLLPAGGGTKEMLMRAVALSEKYKTDVTPFIFKGFQNIGLAKVSMAADELFGMGYMRESDAVSLNIGSLIADAKQKVLALSKNYRPRQAGQNIKAPGRSIAASIKTQLWNMKMGGFATEYEEYMGGVVAGVITGGDVWAGTIVTEQYLLDLEREGFLKLCGNKKTLERIQHMLKKGKPLRN